MKKTALGLVIFVKRCVGRPYIYATYGKILTEASLAWCVSNYPNRFSEYRIRYAKEHYIGKRTDDCEGMIKNYLWSPDGNPDSDPVYNGKQDLSANGAFEAATIKGDISTMPDRPGLCVHKNGHVGVYIGKDEKGRKLVCEAQGFDFGVRINLLDDRPFVHWFEHPWIDYSTEGETCMVELDVLRKGMSDTNGSVTSWQGLLRLYSYTDDSGSEIKTDGKFGAKTEQATKKVQKKHGLPQTGVVDGKTWEALIR